jgi:molybdenum cofactor cytidylyltransferase
MTVAGLILAAGLSERMESDIPKQLLPFGARTMLGHVVATAESTSLDPIIVITGHRADEVAAGIEPERARVVHNPDYETGNLTSLRTGLGEMDDVDAVMLLLADMPGVDAGIITTVAEAWGKDRPFSAVATYFGTTGHPFVLSARAMTQAASLEGTKPLWRWLREQHVGNVLSVEIGRSRPRDVNTMNDYESALRTLGLTEETPG